MLCTLRSVVSEEGIESLDLLIQSFMLGEGDSLFQVHLKYQKMVVVKELRHLAIILE
jgi:hypothetical protein